MRIGIFPTATMTAKVWRKAGLLHRAELHLQNCQKLFESVSFFTHKGSMSFAPNSNVDYFFSPLPTRFWKLETILAPFIFAKEIRRCDLLYFWSLTTAPIGVLSKLLYRKPFMVLYTYVWPESVRIYAQSYLKHLLAHLAELIVFNFADVIAVGTPELVDYVGKITLGKEKIIIRTHFVETDVFVPKTDYALSNPVKILFVGRLEDKQKNILMLIEALQDLPDVELNIIGEGSDKHRINRMAQEKGVQIEFHGRVGNKEVARTMRGADIFCLVSPREGTPKVLLEAMSCGLPCIGTNVFGIAWLLRDGRGLICEPNATDLRVKLEQLLTNQGLRKELGKRARKYIEQNHTVEIVMGQEWKALKKALEASHYK